MNVPDMVCIPHRIAGCPVCRAGKARPFGGYETAQDVVDAVNAGAIVRTEVIEAALLALIGKDFAINFDAPYRPKQPANVDGTPFRRKESD
jgi:hypothetical protein